MQQNCKSNNQRRVKQTDTRKSYYILKMCSSTSTYNKDRKLIELGRNNTYKDKTTAKRTNYQMYKQAYYAMGNSAMCSDSHCSSCWRCSWSCCCCSCSCSSSCSSGSCCCCSPCHTQTISLREGLIFSLNIC